MPNQLRQSGHASGFSLGEMLAALVIGAMVLTAVLTIYSRANQTAEAVLARIDSPALAAEVLQCLSEDLDRVLSAEQGFSIQIKNGLDHGFPRAQLVLRRTMQDSKDQEQTFDEITWLGGYDYDGPSPGLVIYRAHEGINVEDKLLDPKRAGWESNYPLVPMCRGVTFFRIEVPNGDDFIDEWADPGSLPPGIRVTISFAPPYETVRGTLDVPEEQKIRRTIAIDRTRTPKFILPDEEQQGEAADAGADEGTSQTTDEKTLRGAEDPTAPTAGRRMPIGIGGNTSRRNDAQTPARSRRR
jgi:hypothetical protein